MKKAIAIATLIFALNTMAQEGKLEIKGTWETAVASQYLSPEGIVIHDDFILENSLILEFGETGWYAGIWTAFPLDKKPDVEVEEESAEVPTFQNPNAVAIYEIVTTAQQLALTLNPPPEPVPPFEGEIDLYVGYANKFGPVEVDTWLTYYIIGDLADTADDYWGANIHASLPDCPVVQPFCELQYCGQISELSPPAGFFYYTGLTRIQPIGSCDLELELRSAWSNGALGTMLGYQWTRITTSTNIQIAENWKISPSLAYQVGKDEDQFVARLGVGVEF